MNHPTDLLADYVGGALAERERAAVEAHLRRCRRCAGEVALAAASRRALAAMPEEPSPSGLHDAAIAEARRTAPAGGGRVAPIGAGDPRRTSGDDSFVATGSPRWTRWAAAAGIAATIALLAVVLPHAGNPGTTSTAAAPAQAETKGTPLRELPSASAVEVANTNFDSAAIQSLGALYVPAAAGFSASASQPAAAADGTAPAAQGSTTFGPEYALAPERFDIATKCLTRAFDSSIVGRPVRLIEAQYERTPAFIGVYVSGPSGSLPPHQANIYVAARAGCTILTSMQFHSS